MRKLTMATTKATGLVLNGSEGVNNARIRNQLCRIEDILSSIILFTPLGQIFT